MKLLIFFICIPFFANAYTAKNINLTDYEFIRYVRPQLNSITQDYQTLLGLLNPEQKRYQPAFSNHKKIR